MTDTLEHMDDFFNARADMYEEHMFKNVDGADRYYAQTAALLPAKPFSLLDLGCGTGLELDEISKINPQVRVTGIDLSAKMLDKLREKHADKDLTLICGSYFDVDFGTNAYEAVVAVQTMHHFTPQEKAVLYRKIYNALKPSGIYVETDYVAPSLARERAFREEYRALLMAQNADGGFYHFDIPCAEQTQLTLLKKAGFSCPRAVQRYGNTVIFKAEKSFASGNLF